MPMTIVGGVATITGTGAEVVSQLRLALANNSVVSVIVPAGSYSVGSDPQNSERAFFVDHNISITVSGVGRADFHAVENFGKALFVVAPGTSASFSQIGFFDTAADFSPLPPLANTQVVNESGIRHEGANLTIDGCYFQDNLNGILSYATGNLTVTNSTFNGNGSGRDQEHQIYFEGLRADISNNTFIDPNSNGHGHVIKTVTSIGTYVYGNSITTGIFSAPVIDSSGGGELIVGGTGLGQGNSIEFSTNVSDQRLIQYESGRHGGTNGLISIAGNNISVHSPGAIYLIRNLSDSVAQFISNDVYTNGAHVVANSTATGSGAIAQNSALGLAAFASNSLNGGVSDPFAGWAQQAVSAASNSINILTGSSFENTDTTGSAFIPIRGSDTNDLLNDVSTTYNGAVVLFGGAGADVLVGGQSNDWLYGEAGNDLIFTRDSSNAYPQYASGGAGDDTILVGTYSTYNPLVYFDGGDGNDILDARIARAPRLVGGAGNDILIGSTLISGDGGYLSGGAGDDLIYAGKNFQSDIWGGTGSDTLFYDGAYRNGGAIGDFDVRYEGGNWIIYRGAGLNYIFGTDLWGEETAHEFEFMQFRNGRLTLNSNGTSVWVSGNGNAAVDALLSRAAEQIPTSPIPVLGNVLAGTAAAETINGTSGNDIINGLGGNDVLNGGDGDDLFQVNGTADGNDIFNGGLGIDDHRKRLLGGNYFRNRRRRQF
jgi:Ca2+-binding RTX toxin-like protein